VKVTWAHLNPGAAKRHVELSKQAPQLFTCQPRLGTRPDLGQPTISDQLLSATSQMLAIYGYALEYGIDTYYHVSNEAKALTLRYRPSSPEPWHDKEARLLLDIYRTHPSWSYGDIAEQLHNELRAWDPDFRRTRSSRACARQLRFLHRQAQMAHDRASDNILLIPLPATPSNVLLPARILRQHTERSKQTGRLDQTVDEAQLRLCEHCRRLDIGRLHMQRWRGGGPGVTHDTSFHPASQAMEALIESARKCPCCSFILRHIEWPIYLPDANSAFSMDGTRLFLQINIERGLRHTITVSYRDTSRSGGVRQTQVCCQRC